MILTVLWKIDSLQRKKTISILSRYNYKVIDEKCEKTADSRLYGSKYRSNWTETTTKCADTSKSQSDGKTSDNHSIDSVLYGSKYHSNFTKTAIKHADNLKLQRGGKTSDNHLIDSRLYGAIHEMIISKSRQYLKSGNTAKTIKTIPKELQKSATLFQTSSCNSNLLNRKDCTESLQIRLPDSTKYHSMKSQHLSIINTKDIVDILLNFKHATTENMKLRYDIEDKK